MKSLFFGGFAAPPEGVFHRCAEGLPTRKRPSEGAFSQFRFGRSETPYFFRYLSSQPKNSRFHTIEFWGFMT